MIKPAPVVPIKQENAGMSSTSPPSTSSAKCSHCGAERITQAAAPCWLCGQPLPEGVTLGLPQQGSGEVGGIILLTACLLVVAFGVLLYAPGIGLLLFVLLTPLLWGIWRAAASPRTPTGRPGVRSVAAIIGIIVAAAVAGSVAFFAACMGGFFAGAVVSAAAGAPGHAPIGWGLAGAATLGPLAGITVAILILRRLWRKPKTAASDLFASVDPTAIASTEPPSPGNQTPGNQTGIKKMEHE